MFKRICFLIGLNLVVALTISTLLLLTKTSHFVSYNGEIPLQPLIISCLIFGFSGAFISLLFSKIIAKWLFGIKIIKRQIATGQELKIFELNEKIAKRAQLSHTPEIGIFESREVNAFATGRSKSASLIALSSEMIRLMNDDQIEGVIGHEMAHIANGDMLTMTLLQGMTNSFSMILSRLFALAVSLYFRGDKKDKKDREPLTSTFAFKISRFIFEQILLVLSAMLLAWYSRKREFEADYDGTLFTSKDKMISALTFLKDYYDGGYFTVDEKLNQQRAMMMSNPKTNLSFFDLLKTHPPLDERIQRLKQISGSPLKKSVQHQTAIHQKDRPPILR